MYCVSFMCFYVCVSVPFRQNLCQGIDPKQIIIFGKTTSTVLAQRGTKAETDTSTESINTCMLQTNYLPKCRVSKA